jgi:hypothetical protein
MLSRNQDQTSMEYVVGIINTYTEFIPTEIIPFTSTNNIKEMLPYLKNMKNLTLIDIRHIFDVCYNSTLFDIYSRAVSNRYFNQIFDSTASYTNLINNKFIMADINSQLLHFDDWKILNRFGNYHEVIEPASLISPRIAEYYPNINVWKYKRNKDLIYCPSNIPDLRSKKSERHNANMALYCTNNHVWEPDLSTVHDYNPNNGYNIYRGHDVPIKIGEYSLVSYNPPESPELLGRDYYLFLPYEYDPIAKIVYVFSL